MNRPEQPRSPDDRVRDQFFALDTEYRLSLDQETGESWIADIAASAKHESMWIYNPSDSTWQHFKSGEPIDEFDPQVHSQMGFADIAVPRRNGATFYHTHPDHNIERLARHPDAPKVPENIRWLQNQVPSSEDLSATVALAQNGYPEHRIVTARGITVIRFNKESLSPDRHVLFGFSIPMETLEAKYAHVNFSEGIQDLLENIESSSDGVFSLMFLPHKNH